MEFPAHIRIRENGTRDIQSVADHCHKTAAYAAECLSGIGLSKTAYLAGLLPEPMPVRPEELIAAFSWDKVRQGDIPLPDGLF